jgi:reductive dehalogenase
MIVQYRKAGMNEQQRPLSRRGLLKTAAAAVATAPIPRVRTVDKPTLGETNAEFKRFSGATIFALYQELKTKREGPAALKTERAVRRKRVAEWIRQRRPGFSLRDRQLFEAGWTVMRSARTGEGILSWRRLRIATPAELGVPPYTASPEEMAHTVKKAACLYGAVSAGIAPMNENYVNLKQAGKDIVFEPVDLPGVTAQRLVIPKKMKWVVAVAIPMDLDLLARAPTALCGGATTLGYSHCTFAVATLAEFIRGLGYQAIPSVNDLAQNVPFALDAGLGELSRLNRLITPRFGPAVRLAKVFTDMPMTCDKPIDFGAVEFCKRCKRCAQACPAGALSLDDQPGFQVRGPWNNPGHKAWFEDCYKCYRYWQQVTTECSICFAACPFTQAARASASLAPGADLPFQNRDDPFGFGRQPDPEAWWSKS